MIPSSSWSRGGVGALIVVVGALGTWLLLSELARPSAPFFPTDRAALDAAIARRSEAGIAASIGLVRGDLEVEYLLSLGAQVLSAAGQAPASRDQLQPLLAAGERAVVLAPHDSRAWLVLALARSWARQNRDEIGAALKTSYYTGLNDTRLMPLRLRLVTQAVDLADPELQSALVSDIRSIVTRVPSLRDTLVSVYRSASPDAKSIIEKNVMSLDRNFLTVLRQPA